MNHRYYPISTQQFFCALYVLRTGIPWRDLPAEFDSWHTQSIHVLIRWSDNGLF